MIEVGQRFKQNESLAFSDTHKFRNLTRTVRNDWYKTNEKDIYLLFSYDPSDGSSGSVIEVSTPKPRTIMQELSDLADKGDAIGYATRYLKMANEKPGQVHRMTLDAGLLIIGEKMVI